MGRQKGVKNKPKEEPFLSNEVFKELQSKVDNGTTVVTLPEDGGLVRGTYPSFDAQPKVAEVVKEIIVEKIVEKIVEIPAKKTTGFALYKGLKEASFPQGGMGQWWEDPNGTEKVYVPRPEEIYSQFIGDPEGWEQLRDALARAWMEYSLRK